MSVGPEPEPEPGDAAFEVRLPPQPASVSLARRHVHDLLERGGRQDLDEIATLLVSEVVTNALLHAGTEIDVLRDGVDETGVRVEVGDGSPHLPSPPPLRRHRRHRSRPADARVDGRRLGRDPARDGKTVWFQLSGAERDARRPRRAAAPTGPTLGGAGDNVPVELQNMPLLLHAAWQEHAEALLREYLLASLDSDGDDPIQVHAEATDAIAVLEEHVPRAAGGRWPPTTLMGDAIEPHVSAPVIEVPVPVALGARTSRPSTGRSRRRWTCPGRGWCSPRRPSPRCRPSGGGCAVRCCGRPPAARPEPWVTPDDAPPTRRSAAAGTPGRSPRPSHGADRRRPGQPDPRGEPGGGPDPRVRRRRRARRASGSSAIVPERYRQAHVAGFTMYLLVGRKPLLDRPVVVPALRRDGSEVRSSCWCATTASGRAARCCSPRSGSAPADPPLLVGRAGYRRSRRPDRAGGGVRARAWVASAGRLTRRGAAARRMQRRPPPRAPPTAPPSAVPPALGCAGPVAQRDAPDHADGPARAAGAGQLARQVARPGPDAGVPRLPAPGTARCRAGCPAGPTSTGCGPASGCCCRRGAGKAVGFDARLGAAADRHPQPRAHAARQGWTSADCGDVPAYPARVGSRIVCRVQRAPARTLRRRDGRRPRRGRDDRRLPGRRPRR